MSPAEPIGTCARHPDRPGASSCTRCGNFACRECLRDGDDTDARGLCAECRERAGSGRVPWEIAGEPWWRRYFLTVQAALREPTQTFGSLGTGDPIRSLVFGGLSSVLGFAPLMVLVPLAFLLLAALPQMVPGGRADVPNLVPQLLLLGPCIALFYPTLSFLYFTSIGVMFHLFALVLGGKASFSDSMRAAYYTTAWEPISALAMCVYCIPVLGALLILVLMVASAIWRAVALKSFAESAHGLSGSKASLAAGVAAGAWLTLWALVLTLAVGVALMRRF